jgi:hypothetical protein
MRTLIAAFAVIAAVCSCSAQAAPIDSTASGVYLGSDRVCRVVLSRYQTHWVQVDIRCIQFDGVWTASLTTVYAPNICPQGGAYMINPWPPEAVREYLSLISFDPAEQVLLIKRGTDPLAVINGDALPEWWSKIGSAPSPSPYSCAPAISNKPRG